MYTFEWLEGYRPRKRGKVYIMVTILKLQSTTISIKKTYYKYLKIFGVPSLILFIISLILSNRNLSLFSIVISIPFLYYSNKNYLLMLGGKGEQKVTEELLKLPDNYYLLNDINIKLHSKQTRPIQIDHIILCENALFCLETKNWSGSVVGKAKGSWIRRPRPRSRKKNIYNNPIIQTHRHIGALEKIIELNKMDIFKFNENGKDLGIVGVIVFTNPKMKLKCPKRIDVEIIQLQDNTLLDYIQSYKDKLYTIEEIQRLCKLLVNIDSRSSTL